MKHGEGLDGTTHENVTVNMNWEHVTRCIILWYAAVSDVSEATLHIFVLEQC